MLMGCIGISIEIWEIHKYVYLDFRFIAIVNAVIFIMMCEHDYTVDIILNIGYINQYIAFFNAICSWDALMQLKQLM